MSKEEKVQELETELQQFKDKELNKGTIEEQWNKDVQLYKK